MIFEHLVETAICKPLLRTILYGAIGLWGVCGVCPISLSTQRTLQAQEFLSLSGLPGHDVSMALGVSAEGNAAVGASLSGAASDAVQWSSTGEVLRLGTGRAVDVSADGSVVVGCLDCDSLAQAGSPVMWSNGNVAPVLVDPLMSTTTAVSSNGLVVVGYNQAEKALRWTAGTGTVVYQILEGGLVGGGVFNRVNDVSHDGTVMAGVGRSALGTTAVRWTEMEGAHSLGDLAGGDFYSQATAVSDHGNVIVGSSVSEFGEQAFRWTIETGMTALGILPGMTYSSEALAVSDDGTRIVGVAASGPDPFDRTAFVWDVDLGMRNLQEVLTEDYDLDVSDWILHEATGISSDGQTIVGNGSHGAWIARLEVKPQADFDGDGDVDASDLSVWPTHYGKVAGATHKMGDTDSDGDVDGADFLTIQRQLGIGVSFESGNGDLQRIVEKMRIPEPGTCSLAAIALVLLLNGRF